MRNDWLLDWPLPPGVQAVCTHRLGGVSLPPYAGFNLGDHVHDNPDAVAANRAELQAMLGVRPVFLQQVHGVDVLHLQADTPDGSVADACWSATAGVACTIMVADCLPLLLTDASGRVVAAAHAGWRGLAHGVIENTVAALCQHNAVQAHQLSVWLGPCIGPTAFEVGDEVRQAFVAHDPDAQRCFSAHSPAQAASALPSAQPSAPSQKWLADLAGLARARLLALGIAHVYGNDSTPAWCTVLQRSRFFSFRRDGVTGRFAACIWRRG